MPMNRHLLGALVAAPLLTPAAALACSSCGCTLASDWVTQGLTSKPGLRFDLRYDFIDQTQLRSGTHAVDPATIELPTDREIERHTRNHYVTLGIDYSPNDVWGVSVQVPYIDRYHTTIPEEETSLSESKSSALGDVKAVIRYQGFTANRNLGIELGLKLPTGPFRDTFRSGTEAGEPVDRGLQPGTGTTDALIGIYQFGTLAGNWDYFVHGRAQVPLGSRQDYRPGVSFEADAGLHYVGFEYVTPQLQLNLKTGGRDKGAEADTENSGGTLLYVGTGATVKISENLRFYGFVQVPVYQDVNGLQLEPKWILTTGIHVSL
ncbi:MAG: hypothetical protein GC201_06610 [Alphaproteobacteria bacterium]|nr:hypothetical protein [Alphaproteobacteria bacterium]